MMSIQQKQESDKGNGELRRTQRVRGKVSQGLFTTEYTDDTEKAENKEQVLDLFRVFRGLIS